MVRERQSALFVVLVTCARPAQLRASLGRLAASELLPQRIAIVDNHVGESNDPQFMKFQGLQIDWVHPSENLGPAGGRVAGLQYLLRHADLRDDDWVAFVDDDEPLPRPDALRRLFEEAVAWQATDARAAAIGLAGATFDRRRVVNRRAVGPARESVNNLHGWGFPIYRLGPLVEVGGFDTDFFFGSEELDLGLRLTAAGYTLRVHETLANDLRAVWGRPATVSPSTALDPPSWKRYYTLRNILVLARRHGGRSTAARIAVVRGLLKPIASIVHRPSVAMAHIALNSRAILDASLGRMGRRVAPDLTHRSWDRPGVSAGLEEIADEQQESTDPHLLAMERSQVVDLLLADRLGPDTAVRLLTAAGSDLSEARLLVEALDPAIESPVIRWGVGAPINPANFYNDADERTESRT